MTLDLAQVSHQIEAMGEPMLAAGETRRARLEQALAVLASLGDAVADLQARVEQRQGSVSFPLAGLTDNPGRRFPAPAAPTDYAALAVDGSQIASDRHQPLGCYLINVGSAALRYGCQPDASLSSRPQLCYREEDLYVVDPDDPDSRARIEGALLHARRDVEESSELARVVATLPPGLPTLALLDNSLVLWGLVGERFEDYVKNDLLRQYFGHLETVRAAGAERPLALAGYISRPGADSVVNTLRLGLCQQSDCRTCRGKTPRGKRDCDSLSGLTDRELFSALLQTPGERSVLFVNLMNFSRRVFSGAVANFYRGNEVHFFYLNTGEEIARVEVPRWLAEEPALVELAHTLVCDQVRRGQGYPVVLAEAHEQAVVGAADRDQFWYLVETMAADRGLAFALSAKVQSKRSRGV